MAPIAVGDKLPDGTLFYLNSDGKPTAFPVYESLKGKKVVLVAAPGAFTPTCRLDQLPSLSCAVLLFTPQLLYMFLSCLFVNFLLLLFVRWPC
jgi:peroxiredoxin